MKITSRENSLLQRARAVRDGRAEELIFVEGLRLCEEALDSQLDIEAVIYSEQIAAKERAAELIGKLRAVSRKTAIVSEKLLQSVSYTKTPQGIALLARRPTWTEETFNREQPAAPLLVVMYGINNPVNVGAIIRTAEAAGATGVITTKTTSDPFSPGALRGAMGSAFRLPVLSVAGFGDATNYCQGQKIETFASAVSGARLFSEVSWRGPAALVMGPESTGLSETEVAGCAQSVRIPMHGAVESLNVAVAAAVILYEAARQRGL